MNTDIVVDKIIPLNSMKYKKMDGTNTICMSYT